MITSAIVVGSIFTYLLVGAGFAFLMAPSLARYYSDQYGFYNRKIWWTGWMPLAWPGLAIVFLMTIKMQDRFDRYDPKVLKTRVEEQKRQIKQLEKELGIK